MPCGGLLGVQKDVVLAGMFRGPELRTQQRVELCVGRCDQSLARDFVGSNKRVLRWCQIGPGPRPLVKLLDEPACRLNAFGQGVVERPLLSSAPLVVAVLGEASGFEQQRKRRVGTMRGDQIVHHSRKWRVRRHAI